MRLRHHGPSVVIDAPAKLNLFLEVLQRRPDGYHDLETVMVAVDLFDTLRLSPEDGPAIRLDVSAGRGPLAAQLNSVPADESNLCVRAAKLLQQECGFPNGARIELYKRIPTQAGMGGGSSDAAAVLIGLNRLWGLHLTSAELHALAARLGSDLNFFIDSPHVAVCLGRGERVEPVQGLAPMHFVVAHPGSGSSTGAVFQALGDRNVATPVEKFVDTLSTGQPQVIAAEMVNALERPAVRLNSDIEKLLDLMSAHARCAPRMTGSGSACFSLCAGAAEARQLAARLRARHRGPVWICRSALALEAA
jgi:4-diphosphocytidyl-2-C-methyl-D-erythritol kinase